MNHLAQEWKDDNLMITDKERYLFDCNGYLVLRGALSSEELARLNTLVDQNLGPEPEPSQPGRRFQFLEWDQAFRDLLDHPRIFSHLQEWLGDALRVDHCYGIASAEGTPRHDLHLGATPYIPACSYHVRNGRIFSGLTVVTWALTDHAPGQGTFACVPGSHKANFPCPDDIARFEGDDPTVAQVAMKAGDVLIFTEALTHGAWPWTAPWNRRALLYKYTPGHMAWSSRATWPDAILDGCTERQRKLFDPPYVYSVERNALR